MNVNSGMESFQPSPQHGVVTGADRTDISGGLRSVHPVPDPSPVSGGTDAQLISRGEELDFRC